MNIHYIQIDFDRKVLYRCFIFDLLMREPSCCGHKLLNCDSNDVSKLLISGNDRVVGVPIGRLLTRLLFLQLGG
jgi:hypothetical protein